MPRIVGGRARGRQLKVPPAGTRPTSERAREALFNSIRSMLDIHGARVLDLYAGSGAIGLEALSLGAASVVLVERDRRACAVIESNIAAIGLAGAMVIPQSSADYLSGVARGPSRPFDLVFADPPYGLGPAELKGLLTAMSSPEALAPDGLMVVERSARDDELSWPAGAVAIKRRRYSEAVLWYGRRERGPEPDTPAPEN